MSTTPTHTDGDTETEHAEEWRIVPTIPHPDPDVTERYTAAPGPASGFTEARAKELAHGRNHAGEPSPAVTWRAEPTGRSQPVQQLQSVLGVHARYSHES